MEFMYDMTYNLKITSAVKGGLLFAQTAYFDMPIFCICKGLITFLWFQHIFPDEVHIWYLYTYY